MRIRDLIPQKEALVTRDYYQRKNSAVLADSVPQPEDLTRTTWMKDLKDWTQIFCQFGLGAAAIKVIRD